jgi:hypothetical protein
MRAECWYDPLSLLDVDWSRPFALPALISLAVLFPLGLIFTILFVISLQRLLKSRVSVISRR